MREERHTRTSVNRCTKEKEEEEEERPDVVPAEKKKVIPYVCLPTTVPLPLSLCSLAPHMGPS